MRIELLPGMTNVVRFPVERRARATIELLREIAPDVREIGSIAESFGLEPPPPGLREQADADAAEYILNQVRPDPGPVRGAALESMVAVALEIAVTACRKAHDVALRAADAQRDLLHARTEGGYRLARLEDRAAFLTEQMAVLLLEAHVRGEQAEGVARAVGLAQRGEIWTPIDIRAEALFFNDRRTA